MGFPNEIKAFTTKTDNVDEIMAVDINEVQTEVTAIETELGTDPKGTAASVKARIEAIEAQFAIAAGKVLTLLKNLTSQGGDGTLVFPSSGATLTIPASTGLREMLTANRTYYVRTDGDDSHTGLVNSAAGAFLTIQKAVDTIANTLDIAGKTVTVQIGDGTYAENVTLRNVVGYAAPGNLVIQGNSGTPTNVVIAPAAGNAIYGSNISTVWNIQYLKVNAPYGIRLDNNITVRIQGIDFGACSTCHTSIGNKCQLLIIGNYTISGNSPNHYWVGYGGYLECIAKTITITADVAFSQFALAYGYGFYLHYLCTFSLGGHTVTGQRYNIVYLSFVSTNSGGANYFPGNADGYKDATSLYV